MIKKITAIVMAALGLIAIIMGAAISGKDADTSSFVHSAGYYNADSAAFGADFYTYIYDASDTIVDALSDMNNGISEAVAAQNYQIKKAAETTEAVYKAGGMIVIAIGLAILAYAAPKVVAAFVPEDLGRKKEEPVVAAE